MPLTKEQLLQKRFKFIMPYPGSHWEVGDIFYHINNDIYVVAHYPVKMLGVILETYPHIFQLLPWWSDREVNDLPEYLKAISEEIEEYKEGAFESVVKPTKYRPIYGGEIAVDFDDDDELDALPISFYEPATKEEYNAYINQKQQ